MKRILQSFFLFLFLASAFVASAQDRTVSGTVTASDDGSPLPGVSIEVKGTKIGAQTSSDGRYTIKVPSGSSQLVFTYIGFAARTANLGTSNTLNIALTSDSKELSEIVVTGYSVKKKIEVGGSIAKVNGEQFENQPMASFEKALQGRAAGVQVAANNGIPGGTISVQIRGSNSFLGGTQPLYIVDGIQLNGASFGGYTQTNTLAGINSNDIESIEVLKDAASSAIYGAQAANGVVIITTKKGKSGATKFKANVYTGTVDVLKKFDVLNTQEYFGLRTEAITNALPRQTAAATRASVLSEIAQPSTLTDAEIAALPTYAWQDAAFKTGIVQNYEISASGGNDKTTFYTSAAYNKQEASISKVDFKRATLKLNLDHKASDKFSINTNLNLSNLIQNIPFALDGSFLGSVAFSSPLMIPALKIYNTDGSFNTTIPGILNQNVIQVNALNSGDQKTNQLIGSISGTYKIIPALTFKSFYSVEYANINGYSYRDPRTPDGANIGGNGNVFVNQRSNIQTTQTLSFAKSFNSVHKLTSFVGFEYRYDKSSLIEASGRNFPSFLFRNLSAAGTPFSVNQTFTGYKQLSYLGQVSYNYKDKYIVNGNFRYAGSSRFGSDNLFGFFPGVTLAWNINEEDFAKGLTWLDNLKLRASYGQTGRDGGIGNFASRSLYSSTAVYGGVSGINPTGLGNPALKWERVTGLDLGLDYSILKGRFNGTIGVFKNINSDLLLNQPLISTSGFTSITANVGEIEAKGIEFDLTSQNFNTKWGFKWSTNFNFTYTTNKIKSLYGGLDQLPADPSTRVGYQNGALFTFPYAGVNPATGRPLFYDVNDNLTYLPVADDRRYIGTTNVPYFGGLSNTFSYKGFDADILFQYQYGQIFNDGQETFLREVGRRQFNTYRSVYERRWTTPGQLTDIPRAYAGTGTEPQGIGRVAGSNIYQKTDFIRLKSVQFGYTVPTSILRKAKIGSLRVYAQGSNLWTKTVYNGFDPEVNVTATGIIPQSKNYTFGIQLGF